VHSQALKFLIEQLFLGNSWKVIAKTERQRRILKLISLLSEDDRQEDYFIKATSANMYMVRKNFIGRYDLTVLGL
jgi:hypothetical protein